MYDTPQYILNQINSNLEEEKRILLNIYDYLIKIVKQEKMAYSCALEDLYMEYKLTPLINEKWGANILSSRSFKLLEEFENQWRNYRKSYPYGEDEIFVLIDPTWHSIVKEKLVPLIESFQRDFETTDMDYFKGDLSEVVYQPTNQDVLQRVSTLYNLLINHGVMNKEVK
ncbi:MAG: hypothetical protein J5I94_02770 [Phaeodactylibacter sp.]|nr:hypothetical protein [Phaeodactylibacter sp.]